MNHRLWPSGDGGHVDVGKVTLSKSVFTKVEGFFQSLYEAILGRLEEKKTVSQKHVYSALQHCPLCPSAGGKLTTLK